MQVFEGRPSRTRPPVRELSRGMSCCVVVLPQPYGHANSGIAPGIRIPQVFVLSCGAPWPADGIVVGTRKILPYSPIVHALIGCMFPKDEGVGPGAGTGVARVTSRVVRRCLRLRLIVCLMATFFFFFPPSSLARNLVSSHRGTLSSDWTFQFLTLGCPSAVYIHTYMHTDSRDGRASLSTLEERRSGRRYLGRDITRMHAVYGGICLLECYLLLVEGRRKTSSGQNRADPRGACRRVCCHRSVSRDRVCYHAEQASATNPTHISTSAPAISRSHARTHACMQHTCAELIRGCRGKEVRRRRQTAGGQNVEQILCSRCQDDGRTL